MLGNKKNTGRYTIVQMKNEIEGFTFFSFWTPKYTLTNILKQTEAKQMSVLILGGSISGLLSAAALCKHADLITIIEKDEQEHELTGKKGTPQDVHVHGLVEAGRVCMEKILPGFTKCLIKNGARAIDRTKDFHWFRDGWQVEYESGSLFHITSRPVYEKTIRELVLEKLKDKLVIRYNTRVTDYLFSSSGSEKVEGIVLANGETLKADLVIDAMGRTSQTESWLSAHGYESPEVTRVNINLSYASNIYEFNEDVDVQDGLLIIGTEKSKKGAGVVRLNPESIPIPNRARENKKYMIFSLYGYHDEQPMCRSNNEFTEFAASLPTDEIVNLLKKGTPLYESPKSFTVPAQTWKRYEKFSSHEFPKNFLAVGDSIVSLNPTFGQGMATAARHAFVLFQNSEKILKRKTSTFAIQKKLAAKIWLPFMMNAMDDTKWSETTGYKPPMAHTGQRFMNKAFNAGKTNSKVMTTLLQIAQLEVSPANILRPDVFFSIMIH